MFCHDVKNSFFFKNICIGVMVCFFATTVLPREALAQSLASPSSPVSLSPSFAPALIRGLRLYPENPVKFDFVIASGDLKLSGDEIKQESEKLIRYFLAGLTIPENDLWVNLSPYEKDRIIPEALGQTEMGADMLAQDYLLKRMAASLIFPESDLGKKFWDRVYQKAYEQYGTTNIPVDTFNKVWVVPQKAVIYENGDKAFIVEAKLKVMLEEDYVALSRLSEKSSVNRETQNVSRDTRHASQNKLASDIVRQVFIPEIEREVNQGKNFALLRQIYYSLVLACWYKNNLKDSILNQAYSNRSKTRGVDIADKQIAAKIYEQYLESFKKGVCNLIKVEHDPYTNKNIPRKYFAGGFGFEGIASSTIVTQSENFQQSLAQEFQKEVERSSTKGSLDPFFLVTTIGADPHRVSPEALTQKKISSALSIKPFKQRIGLPWTKFFPYMMVQTARGISDYPSMYAPNGQLELQRKLLDPTAAVREERGDIHIHQQSGDEFSPVAELLDNAIDAMLRKIGIVLPLGQFGEGALQSLSYLQKSLRDAGDQYDGDAVIWQTSTESEQGLTARRVMFYLESDMTSQEQKVQLAFERMSEGSYVPGTTVQVKSSKLDPARIRYIKEHVRSIYGDSNQVRIYLDGELVNKRDGAVSLTNGELDTGYLSEGRIDFITYENGFELRDQAGGMSEEVMMGKLPIPYIGENTPELRAKLEKDPKATEAKAETTATLSDTMEIKLIVGSRNMTRAPLVVSDYGSPLPEKIVVRLPIITTLTDDKDDIVVDRKTETAMHDVVRKFFDSAMVQKFVRSAPDTLLGADGQYLIAVINGLSRVMAEFQPAVATNGYNFVPFFVEQAKEKFFRPLAQRFQDKIVFLPNNDKFRSLSLSGGTQVFYLDEMFFSDNTELFDLYCHPSRFIKGGRAYALAMQQKDEQLIAHSKGQALFVPARMEQALEGSEQLTETMEVINLMLSDLGLANFYAVDPSLETPDTKHDVYLEKLTGFSELSAEQKNDLRQRIAHLNTASLSQVVGMIQAKSIRDQYAETDEAPSNPSQDLPQDTSGLLDDYEVQDSDIEGKPLTARYQVNKEKDTDQFWTRDSRSQRFFSSDHFVSVWKSEKTGKRSGRLNFGYNSSGFVFSYRPLLNSWGNFFKTKLSHGKMLLSVAAKKSMRGLSGDEWGLPIIFSLIGFLGGWTSILYSSENFLANVEGLNNFSSDWRSALFMVPALLYAVWQLFKNPSIKNIFSRLVDFGFLYLVSLASMMYLWRDSTIVLSGLLASIAAWAFWGHYQHKIFKGAAFRDEDSAGVVREFIKAHKEQSERHINLIPAVTRVRVGDKEAIADIATGKFAFIENIDPDSPLEIDDEGNVYYAVRRSQKDPLVIKRINLNSEEPRERFFASLPLTDNKKENNFHHVWDIVVDGNTVVVIASKVGPSRRISTKVSTSEIFMFDRMTRKQRTRRGFTLERTNSDVYNVAIHVGSKPTQRIDLPVVIPKGFTARPKTGKYRLPVPVPQMKGSWKNKYYLAINDSTLISIDAHSGAFHVPSNLGYGLFHVDSYIDSQEFLESSGRYGLLGSRSDEGKYYFSGRILDKEIGDWFYIGTLLGKDVGQYDFDSISFIDNDILIGPKEEFKHLPWKRISPKAKAEQEVSQQEEVATVSAQETSAGQFNPEVYQQRFLGNLRFLSSDRLTHGSLEVFPYMNHVIFDKLDQKTIKAMNDFLANKLPGEKEDALSFFHVAEPVLQKLDTKSLNIVVTNWMSVFGSENQQTAKQFLSIISRPQRVQGQAVAGVQLLESQYFHQAPAFIRDFWLGLTTEDVEKAPKQAAINHMVKEGRSSSIITSVPLERVLYEKSKSRVGTLLTLDGTIDGARSEQALNLKDLLSQESLTEDQLRFFREKIIKIVKSQDPTTFLREMIQNARDALRLVVPDGVWKPRIDTRVYYIERPDGKYELVTEIQDNGVGMDDAVILNKLFPINETTKFQHMGMGFYTIFAGTKPGDRVEIETTRGNGKATILECSKTDNQGVAIELMKEVALSFADARATGTWVRQRRVFDSLNELHHEYHLAKTRLQFYCGAVADAEIYFNDEKINEDLELVASEPFGNLGQSLMYIYKTLPKKLYNRILHDGLSMPKSLDTAATRNLYWRSIPKEVQEALLALGVNTDIAAGIMLTKARTEPAYHELVPSIQKMESLKAMTALSRKIDKVSDTRVLAEIAKALSESAEDERKYQELATVAAFLNRENDSPQAQALFDSFDMAQHWYRLAIRIKFPTAAGRISLLDNTPSGNMTAGLERKTRLVVPQVQYQEKSQELVREKDQSSKEKTTVLSLFRNRIPSFVRKAVIAIVLWSMLFVGIKFTLYNPGSVTAPFRWVSEHVDLPRWDFIKLPGGGTPQHATADDYLKDERSQPLKVDLDKSIEFNDGAPQQAGEPIAFVEGLSYGEYLIEYFWPSYSFFDAADESRSGNSRMSPQGNKTGKNVRIGITITDRKAEEKIPLFQIIDGVPEQIEFLEGSESDFDISTIKEGYITAVNDVKHAKFIYTIPRRDMNNKFDYNSYHFYGDGDGRDLDAEFKDIKRYPDLHKVLDRNKKGQDYKGAAELESLGHVAGDSLLALNLVYDDTKGIKPGREKTWISAMKDVQAEKIASGEEEARVRGPCWLMTEIQGIFLHYLGVDAIAASVFVYKGENAIFPNSSHADTYVLLNGSTGAPQGTLRPMPWEVYNITTKKVSGDYSPGDGSDMREEFNKEGSDEDSGSESVEEASESQDVPPVTDVTLDEQAQQGSSEELVSPEGESVDVAEAIKDVPIPSLEELQSRQEEIAQKQEEIKKEVQEIVAQPDSAGAQAQQSPEIVPEKKNSYASDFFYIGGIIGLVMGVIFFVQTFQALKRKKEEKAQQKPAPRKAPPREPPAVQTADLSSEGVLQALDSLQKALDEERARKASENFAQETGTSEESIKKLNAILANPIRLLSGEEEAVPIVVNAQMPSAMSFQDNTLRINSSYYNERIDPLLKSVDAPAFSKSWLMIALECSWTIFAARHEIKKNKKQERIKFYIKTFLRLVQGVKLNDVFDAASLTSLSSEEIIVAPQEGEISEIVQDVINPENEEQSIVPQEMMAEDLFVPSDPLDVAQEIVQDEGLEPSPFDVNDQSVETKVRDVFVLAESTLPVDLASGSEALQEQLSNRLAVDRVEQEIARTKTLTSLKEVVTLLDQLRTQEVPQLTDRSARVELLKKIVETHKISIQKFQEGQIGSSTLVVNDRLIPGRQELGTGSVTHQIWEDVEKYRSSLKAQGIKIDPFVEAIWLFEDHAFSRKEKNSHSFNETKFPSARLGLDIEQKWNLPVGLTELDIWRLSWNSGYARLLFPHRKYKEIMKKLWQEIQKLNPELESLNIEVDRQIGSHGLSSEAWNVFCGIASRFSLGDILFFVDYRVNRHLPQGYEERLKNIEERLKISFNFFPSLATMAKIEQGIGSSAMTKNGITPSASLGSNEQRVKDVGGIDFNSTASSIETKGRGIDFNVPQEVLEIDLMQIEGLAPVIINIVPVTNFNVFLSMDPEESKDRAPILSKL